MVSLIENQLPTTDAEGKALIGEGNIFDFNIVANTTAAPVNYEVVVEKLAKSDLDGSNVKIYLTDTTTTEEVSIGKSIKDGKVVTYNDLLDTTIEGKTGKTIFDEVILKGSENYTRNFRLRMWLSEDADLSDDAVHSKTFSVKVNVYANAGHSLKNKPTITLTGNNPYNISIGKTYTEPGAVAKDWKGQILTPIISGTVDTSKVGDYIITYKVVDSIEGETTTTRTVSVRNLPTISLIGDSEIDVALNKTYTDLGVVAKDYANKDLTPVITGNVNINVVGSNTLTYTVTDSLGGVKAITRIVNVRDLPTITLKGDNPINIVQGTSYIEPGYTAKDWNNTPLTAIISGLVNTNVNGTNTLTYTVTDNLDGIKQITRTVNVTGTRLKDAVVAGLGSTGTIYNASDGSKYIRGESNKVNNYVWYSGMMWRIYRINPDGSVKVVMDDNASALPFHDTSNVYETSHMKTWLNTYFWDRLNSSKTSVLKQNNEFCVDGTDTSASARETCTSTGILSKQKIGMLTLDEYNIVKNGSSSNYLNNGLEHWTMTPHTLGAITEWLVYFDGRSGSTAIGNAYGARAVVHFTETITVAYGNGSQSNPYKIVGDVATATSGAKLNTRYSGELIIYGNKLFRITEVSNGLTKVVYDGEAKITPDGIFGTNNLDWNTMKTRLESSGISTIKLVINQTWQRGYMIGGNNALTTSLGNGNAVTSTFGLPKVGEMWSSQNNIKTTNYAKYANQNYWMMTPHTFDASSEWMVNSGGSNGSDGAVGVVRDARPAFFFKEDITIKDGNGTPDSPYTLN